MKLIIAGGRDYWLTKQEFSLLDAIHRKHTVTEEVCGCATGVDSCGKVWAILNEIPVIDFPADWKRSGALAGPIRNAQMADYADAVALFRGGRGTADMYNAARKAGLLVFDYR